VSGVQLTHRPPWPYSSTAEHPPVERKVRGSAPRMVAIYLCVAQPGRAPALEAGGRWIEASRTDQLQPARRGIKAVKLNLYDGLGHESRQRI
jgi:hypothetical protein